LKYGQQKKNPKKNTQRTLTELERKFKGMFVWWNIWELVKEESQYHDVGKR
jgi:hypothetical protein